MQYQHRALTFVILAGLLAGGGSAQEDRSLRFAWPSDAHAVVTNKNVRDQKSFTLRFEIRAKAAEDDSNIVLTRSSTTVTQWNGKPVPASKRSLLAPLELSMDLLPAWSVNPDGVLVDCETHAEFSKRAKAIVAARTSDDPAAAKAAQPILTSAINPARYRGLCLQTERQWDEWVGRWNALDFAAEPSDSFEGQIELATTGDVVDGRFDVEHAGADPERQDHVQLRIDFAAAGPRLEAAAIRWRQQLFGGGEEEAFEKIGLAVSEHTTVVTEASTLLPAQIDSRRSTVVTVDKQERRFEAHRSWTFAWQ